MALPTGAILGEAEGPYLGMKPRQELPERTIDGLIQRLRQWGILARRDLVFQRLLADAQRQVVLALGARPSIPWSISTPPHSA
jgi:hypothetical protein